MRIKFGRTSNSSLLTALMRGGMNCGKERNVQIVLRLVH